jgi:O-antigen/teichoic acid export membrane protein
MHNKYIRLHRRIVTHPLLKASLIYSISDAINKAIPFLLLPVLTYYLSPNDFGITTNYNVYVNILGIFVSLSLNGALTVNYYKFTKEQTAAYLSNVLILMFIAFIVFVFITWTFADYLAFFLPIPRHYVVAGAAVALGQGITAINLDLWRLQEKALKFGLYEIAQGLFAILLSLLLLVYFHLKWQARVDASLATATFFGICSLVFIGQRGYLTFKLNKSLMTDALRYGIPMIPYTLSVWFRMGIDRIYITRFWGPSETGIYAAGLQFGIVISFFTLAFNNAFTPYVFKTLSTDGRNLLEEKKLKLVKFTYTYFFVLIFISLVAVFAAGLVIDHLLSANYSGAKQFLVLIIFSQALQGMCLMFGLYIMYAKKTSMLGMITVVCSALQVIISYQLVKRQGAIGAAYATTIVNLINLAAIWICSARTYRMPWDMRSGNYKPDRFN